MASWLSLSWDGGVRARTKCILRRHSRDATRPQRSSGGWKNFCSTLCIRKTAIQLLSIRPGTHRSGYVYANRTALFSHCTDGSTPYNGETRAGLLQSVVCARSLRLEVPLCNGPRCPRRRSCCLQNDGPNAKSAYICMPRTDRLTPDNTHSCLHRLPQSQRL